MGSYHALRGRVNSVGFLLNERLIPYLELVGSGSATLIRTFDLRYDLISTLVERWHPETHTFYFPCAECTITLEDIALQLELPIDGNVITGPSLEYIQWYSEIGKPFLFGERSMVVPPHMTRIGQTLPDPYHASELEAEPELHSVDSSYHPDLGGDDYCPSLSGQGYHSEFDIFIPLPP
ncbi:hypothetical protein PVK06_005224 [Gossypium arboreum]|uniref:Aminotransferase-like plant mobile domain-containing protein n=1 Tax=Gossypium arboreum TaxID=29729 RepID=A0ABR0QVD9_GOSAR|nr:hypothetical protein PVK06_005224 [Gossypium arboreum]